MKKTITTALALGGIILFSCQKNVTPPTDLKVDQTKVFRMPQTTEEKQLVENLGKITVAFKELYKDKENILLVKEVLDSRKKGDKAVFLRDLIDAENTSLTENKVLMKNSPRKKTNN